jgi:Transposase, Mutator family
LGGIAAPALIQIIEWPVAAALTVGHILAHKVDGIHVHTRLEEHKLCLLVMIGVRADGRKELVALTDGYRESMESWADLLRDCARRGMHAPVLAMGDGALGFWGALREMFPTTREQRCWFHKIGNVLGALPKSAHPGAKKALAEIWNAEDKQHALDAVTSFKAVYGAKFGKAVAKITDDLEVLLAFYDYPAEHWIHLRPRTPSNRPSRPCGTARRSLAAPAHARPGSRWPSSSSRPPRTAGERSTLRTWSRSSAPARCSSTASSSNDPTKPINPKPPKDLHPQVLTIAHSTPS